MIKKEDGPRRKESKEDIMIEKKKAEREREVSREEKERVSLLIEQTCRQPDSQEDVCPCAATLWPADTPPYPVGVAASDCVCVNVPSAWEVLGLQCACLRVKCSAREFGI